MANITRDIGYFVGRYPLATGMIAIAVGGSIYFTPMVLGWMSAQVQEGAKPPAPTKSAVLSSYSASERAVIEAAAARRAVIAQENAERQRRCDAGAPAVMAAARDKLKVKQPDAALALLSGCSEFATDPAFKALHSKAQSDSAAMFKQALKVRDAESLAKRKKEGVRIGMSPEEVILSSWGKPRKINRTTTATRQREQWVYDGGYLYFENGILVTIQN
ncbi:MAG: hypothetical protein V4669_13915 [Pseudomonadota bacterium]